MAKAAVTADEAVELLSSIVMDPRWSEDALADVPEDTDLGRLCRTLADSLDIPVICGDAISFDTMRTADVASCDAFVAVTGSDEDTLIASQLAKREFGVDRTVARASNPKNR